MHAKVRRGQRQFRKKMRARRARHEREQVAALRLQKAYLSRKGSISGSQMPSEMAMSPSTRRLVQEKQKSPVEKRVEERRKEGRKGSMFRFFHKEKSTSKSANRSGGQSKRDFVPVPGMPGMFKVVDREEEEEKGGLRRKGSPVSPQLQDIDADTETKDERPQLPTSVVEVTRDDMHEETV